MPSLLWLCATSDYFWPTQHIWSHNWYVAPSVHSDTYQKLFHPTPSHLDYHTAGALGCSLVGLIPRPATSCFPGYRMDPSSSMARNFYPLRWNPKQTVLSLEPFHCSLGWSFPFFWNFLNRMAHSCITSCIPQGCRCPSPILFPWLIMPSLYSLIKTHRMKDSHFACIFNPSNYKYYKYVKQL